MDKCFGETVVVDLAQSPPKLMKRVFVLKQTLIVSSLLQHIVDAQVKICVNRAKSVKRRKFRHQLHESIADVDNIFFLTFVSPLFFRVCDKDAVAFSYSFWLVASKGLAPFHKNCCRSSTCKRGDVEIVLELRKYIVLQRKAMDDCLYAVSVLPQLMSC